MKTENIVIFLAIIIFLGVTVIGCTRSYNLPKEPVKETQVVETAIQETPEVEAQKQEIKPTPPPEKPRQWFKKKITADVDGDGIKETIICGNETHPPQKSYWSGFCYIEKTVGKKKIRIDVLKSTDPVPPFEDLKLWYNSRVGSTLLLILTRAGSGGYLTPYIFKYDKKSGKFKNILSFEDDRHIKPFLSHGNYKIDNSDIIFTKADDRYFERCSCNCSYSWLAPRTKLLYVYDRNKGVFIFKKKELFSPGSKALKIYHEALERIKEGDHSQASKQYSEARNAYTKAERLLKQATKIEYNDAFQRALDYCRRESKK